VSDEAIDDADVVHIKTGWDGPGLTQHSRAGDAVTRQFGELRAEWDAMIDKIAGLADSADKRGPSGGLRLSELVVELGFTATGKLAFIAEAEASASITLTFARQTDSASS
jgi:hypothetical protein